MFSEYVRVSSGSQLAVYVRSVSASCGLLVWCDRDILAGYHAGSVGPTRAKTGVPSGGVSLDGGVGAGAMVGLKAVAPYVAPSVGFWVVGCCGGVPSGRRRVFFGFGLRHCQGFGGVLGCVFVCDCLYL